MVSESRTPHRGSLISAMFLVGGTCIGGGMLALPVATGMMGFLPSVVIMAVCWAMMTFTGLLLLEVSLWLEEGAHVITMSSRLLGKYGKAAAWILYLFICYASIVAYTAGGGSHLTHVLEQMQGITISKATSCTAFIVVFGVVIYLGSRIVGRVNAVLFVAMILAYIGLVTIGIPEIKPELLMHKQWQGSAMAVPLLLTSFSFQTMVPSLTPYLRRNVRWLRLAIVCGTSIAFVVYFIWQALVLGIVPVEGANGLQAALAKGEPATFPLRAAVGSQMISYLAEYFAFFALVTSFFGMALGLYDFLADGLKIKKEGLGKLWLALLIAIPTLFFAVFFERVFLVALGISGGFGDSILNGIMPVLMVWSGRYRLGMKGPFRVPGGKGVLVVVLILYVCALGIEVSSHMGWSNSLYDQAETIESLDYEKL